MCGPTRDGSVWTTYTVPLLYIVLRSITNNVKKERDDRKTNHQQQQS